MASPKVDLGIHLENGWPVHKRECDECQGVPARAEHCGGCRTRGYAQDRDCECAKCCELAAAEQRRRERERKWANASNG